MLIAKRVRLVISVVFAALTLVFVLNQPVSADACSDQYGQCLLAGQSSPRLCCQQYCSCTGIGWFWCAIGC